LHEKIPVACCHNVFTKEQRLAYTFIWQELEKRKLGITELVNGYEYQFQGDSETLRLINEWASMERKCCPFLTFTVIASNMDKPVLLQLTGNDEAKAFLHTEIDLNIRTIISNH